MLFVKPFSEKGQVVLTADQPHYSLETVREVDRLWQQELEQRHGGLFNGRIVSAVQVADEQIDARIVEYKYYIAQILRPELFEELYVRPCAVAGLFVCKDGIVFGKRSGALAQDGGLWELAPSGGLDASSTVVGAPVDYGAQIRTELNEELGLEHLDGMWPFCLIEDDLTHVIDIGIRLQCDLSASDLAALHAVAGSYEYTEIRVVGEQQLESFESRISEVSLRLLSVFKAQSGAGRT